MKHDNLLQQENNLKENLQNEVTKIKEKLEDYLSELNNQIKISYILEIMFNFIKNVINLFLKKINYFVNISRNILNEKIIKAYKNLDKYENNLIATLSYISKISKSEKKMKKIFAQLMKSAIFKYEDEKGDIKYEEYYFNGIYIPMDIKYSEVTLSSLNISWKIDNIKIKNIDMDKVKYILEIRKENEEFKKVYEGNNTNFTLNNLLINDNYEFRICSFYNDLIVPWIDNQKLSLREMNNLDFIESLNPKINLSLDTNSSKIVNDEYMVLKKGDIQYGPYKHYEKGKYLIIYWGEGLLDAELDVIENTIQEPISFKILNKSTNIISYEVIISIDLKSGIEFRAFNKKDTFILIKKIDVYKYKI